LQALGLLKNRGVFPDTKILLIVPPVIVPSINKIVSSLSLPSQNVIVKPFMSQESLATLLKKSAIYVSPSISDGTPNSMLEAMACGAFPVMGNLESLREWIDHGVNGFLFDPNDSDDLANCLQQALDNVSVRQKAQNINLKIVQDRANYAKIMPDVRNFYQYIIDKSHSLDPSKNE
jgi:glycosyltransferase involved in cell wall biosynthesis